jgi:hypothetical protein
MGMGKKGREKTDFQKELDAAKIPLKLFHSYLPTIKPV